MRTASLLCLTFLETETPYVMKVMTDAKGKGKSEWSEEAEFTTPKKDMFCVYIERMP